MNKTDVCRASWVAVALAVGLGLGSASGGAAAAGVPTRYDCLIVPDQSAELGAEVRGVLSSISVERGERVTANQVVAELNSELERASVALARARAEMETDVRQSEVRLAFAARQRVRILDLFGKKAIPESDMDQAETDVLLAELNLEQARSNQRLAELEYERTLAALEQRRIRAPFDGVVVQRFMSVGELVERESVLEVASVNPLRVDAVLPVMVLGSVEVGSVARVFPEAPVGGELAATVTIVDAVVDAASGTFGVRLSLPNPEYKLSGGLKCEVEFDSAR